MHWLSKHGLEIVLPGFVLLILANVIAHLAGLM